MTCHCVFPPERVRLRPEEGRTDEASKVHGRADYRAIEGAGGWAKTADLARKHGVSEATIYNLKAKFGGMDVSEAKRLRALEEENAKLKKLLAEQMLDAAALRELLSKKW
ncbi:transposase [Bradyrhizobium agreste]